MTKIRFYETAKADYDESIALILGYFDDISSPNLAEKHLAIYKNELKTKLQRIKESPKSFPIRTDEPFVYSEVEFRSFVAHWFTILYYYEENNDTAWILAIRSSKSDLSTILSNNILADF